jgi:hypothetical protein
MSHSPRIARTKSELHGAGRRLSVQSQSGQVAVRRSRRSVHRKRTIKAPCRETRQLVDKINSVGAQLKAEVITDIPAEIRERRA